MKSFGPANGLAWAIYSQDRPRKVVKSFLAGECCRVTITDAVRLPDGQLISQQPDGVLEVRPADSGVGDYERIKVNANTVTFSPVPDSGVAYVYVATDCPN